MAIRHKLYVTYSRQPSGMIDAEVCIASGSGTSTCGSGLGKRAPQALRRALYDLGDRVVSRGRALDGTEKRFRTPSDSTDARRRIQKLKKGIKKAELELADASQNQYSLGVTMAKERIAELHDAILHFEKWVK